MVSRKRILTVIISIIAVVAVICSCQSNKESDQADSGALTTITVGGVEVSEEDASEYDGDVVTTYTEILGDLSSLTYYDDFPYRTALYVKDGQIDEKNSVASALVGTYDEVSMEGVTIESTSDDITGLILSGSDYTITNSTIVMNTESDGSKTNDFSGLGAAIINTNGGLLEIHDSVITTQGVAKTAIFTDNGSNTIVYNSTLEASGGTLYDGYYANASQLMMVAPPWTLGLNDSEANARTTNLMGAYSTQTFVDCTVNAAGWGSLSTDADGTADYSLNQHLIAVNTSSLVEGSGYATYVQADDIVDFYGVDLDVSTYAGIMCGGELVISSYTGGQEIDVIQYSEESEFEEKYIFGSVKNFV